MKGPAPPSLPIHRSDHDLSYPARLMLTPPIDRFALQDEKRRQGTPLTFTTDHPPPLHPSGPPITLPPISTSLPLVDLTPPATAFAGTATTSMAAPPTDYLSSTSNRDTPPHLPMASTAEMAANPYHRQLVSISTADTMSSYDPFPQPITPLSRPIPPITTPVLHKIAAMGAITVLDNAEVSDALLAPSPSQEFWDYYNDHEESLRLFN